MNYSKFIDDLCKSGIKHDLKVTIGIEEYITNNYSTKLQNVQSGEYLTTDEIIDKYAYRSVEIPRDDSKMILTYRGHKESSIVEIKKQDEIDNTNVSLYIEFKEDEDKEEVLKSIRKKYLTDNLSYTIYSIQKDL